MTPVLRASSHHVRRSSRVRGALPPGRSSYRSARTMTLRSGPDRAVSRSGERWMKRILRESDKLAALEEIGHELSDEVAAAVQRAGRRLMGLGLRQTDLVPHHPRRRRAGSPRSDSEATPEPPADSGTDPH